jgi:uncharacterized membrane protein
MKRFDHNALKQETAACLSQATYPPKRLVLLHTGVTLLLSLILAALDLLLSRQIGATGGLGGMDRRALLTTVQSALRFTQAAVLPFWSMGYVHVTLQISREEPVSPPDLLEGFRQFGPVLRLTFLETTLFLAMGFFGSQIGSLLFLMTPWAQPMLDALLPILSAGGELPDTNAMILAMEHLPVSSLIPFWCVVAGVCLAVALPIFYRFRLARMHLMDYPKRGALRALFYSARHMKGNYLAMLRLDLHFWWYHVLSLLAAALFYADTLAELMGLRLPWPEEVSYLLAFLLYATATLLLHLWRRNEVHLTYVNAYHLLDDPPKEDPQPSKVPWNY